MLSFCVLVTTCPDMPAPRSVSAAEETAVTGKRHISGFAQLPEEIREQTVPTGTALEELTLPDTLEAVVTAEGESQPPEDTEGQPGDDSKEDAGESDGTEEGGESDAGESGGKEDGETSDGENGVTEGDGETEDKNSETGDGQDVQPEDGESEEADETTATENGDKADTEKEENGEEESAPAEEQVESETVQENTFSEEKRESAHAQVTYTVTMQEYLAENVLLVQTLENTQAEAQEEAKKKEQEEAINIEGVTWRSEPSFDGNTEGIYTFTAVLPEGYALAEGVSLPEITVTVGIIDAVIQELLARIAALPEVDTFLAAEPEVEDEDAYEEWEEKLYAYAEEALAIWEAYELLTEEQQAQMPEEALAKLTAWVELAGMMTGHTVTMVGANEIHEHNGVTFQEWSRTDRLPPEAGNYCLTNNVTLGDFYEIPGNMNLCLCGHKIEGSVSNGMIRVNRYALNIYDCQGGGAGILS